jgi:hypothetical protein
MLNNIALIRANRGDKGGGTYMRWNMRNNLGLITLT